MIDEQKNVRARVTQMEEDMLTLKSKLADSKSKLKGLETGKTPGSVTAPARERLSPGERKIRRAMGRFDRLQAQVDNLEARVASYEVGGTVTSGWSAPAQKAADPEIEEELERLKKRVAGTHAPETAEPSDNVETSGTS